MKCSFTLVWSHLPDPQQEGEGGAEVDAWPPPASGGDSLGRVNIQVSRCLLQQTSSVPHFQDSASIPGVGHWGGKPRSVAHFQETIPARFLKSSPVDGGITAGLCDQLWRTGEDARGSLGTGARKTPVDRAPMEC